jgi:muramoyltetrapeptide carboxypeptidase
MSQALKPVALRAGDALRIVSLSSPVHEDRVRKGIAELERLGYRALWDPKEVLASDGFFAGSTAARAAALKSALHETETQAVICSRGGYGVNYLLQGLHIALECPKLFIGYSDLTSLQIFLWQRFRWVTLYGPMVAAGLDITGGATGVPGYDAESFRHATTSTRHGWAIKLDGAESLAAGAAEGILRGGCLTLLYTSIGTPWELETEGSILVLEDRGMKPWQVDRALIHLLQAGKFRGVAAVVLGDFPDCEGPPGTETVKDVVARVLQPLKIPVVYGAAIGHTARAMLTIPLGVRARLDAGSPPWLEILEPACRERA